MKPTEPGYYFYFDGEQRYLVNISRSLGAEGKWDGPLMVSELRLDLGAYTIATINEMDGEWSMKLELLGRDRFEDWEAQEMFDQFSAKCVKG